MASNGKSAVLETPEKPTQINKSIQILDMCPRMVEIDIEGVTELISNRFGPLAIAALEASQDPDLKVSKKNRPARNKQAECDDCLWEIRPGVYGYPSINLKAAMVEAARFTDVPMTKMRGAVQVIGGLLPIVTAEPYYMRVDPVKLPNGSGHIAYRPCFKLPWKITVPIKYNSTLISLEHVVNLVKLAGFSSGIGSWRPNKDGTFGQFDLGEIREISYK